jgi:(S)-mandelate dehydrogenase
MNAYNIAELRQMAKRRLPRAVFDFIDGGAEDERTLRDNCEAFGRERFAPKQMVDVSAVDTSTTILGGPSKLPIAIAPTGAVGLAWRGGDIAIARAAAAMGIPYSLSMSATASIETIAREAPGRLWFQAYFLKPRDTTFALIDRAHAAGYEALIVTCDVPVGGKRERDHYNHFTVPFRYTPRNLVDFALRPAWALDMLFRGIPKMENLERFAPGKTDTKGLASSVARNNDAALDWEVLKQVRERWKGKLLLKGVLRPDDAERAVAIGCEGVIVSNHGGRQLDSAVCSFDALPGIARAVGGKASVLMDGGVRRGSDVVKAVARGAQAVMTGRATLFGAAAAGAPGAQRALDILATELVRTMQLCGVRRVSEIGPEILFGSSARTAAVVEGLEGDGAAVAGHSRPHLVGPGGAR